MTPLQYFAIRVLVVAFSEKKSFTICRNFDIGFMVYSGSVKFTPMVDTASSSVPLCIKRVSSLPSSKKLVAPVGTCHRNRIGCLALLSWRGSNWWWRLPRPSKKHADERPSMTVCKDLVLSIRKILHNQDTQFFRKNYDSDVEHWSSAFTSRALSKLVMSTTWNHRCGLRTPLLRGEKQKLKKSFRHGDFHGQSSRNTRTHGFRPTVITYHFFFSRLQGRGTPARILSRTSWLLVNSKWFACHETPSLTYSCVSTHLASVSKYLHFERLPVASLENARLDFASCLNSVSRRWLRHRLVPLWHSLGCWNRFKSSREFSSYSRGCATPNSKVSASPSPNSKASTSPSPNLLRKIPSCPLFDMALCFLFWKKEMAARDNREIHDMQQTKMMVPLITCETSFGWDVCELVFGVNTFDLDLVFRFDSVEQPIKRNFVGSWHVTHRWTSSFENHVDGSFIVFQNVQLRLTLRRMCVSGCVIQIRQLINSLSSFVRWGLGFGIGPRTSSLDAIMVGLYSVVGRT